MIRQLRKWYGAIALSAALFCILSQGALASEIDARAEGSSLGSAVQGRYGGQNAVQHELFAPLTSSGREMETFDGTKGFGAQLGFPSSRRFLEVFVQPGSTGDLNNVIAGQDTNFDGNLDYSYQVPVPVSGVCANGLISCTPGTWENCQYYVWQANEQGRVSLAATEVFSVGGCYCVNNDCGNGLVWANLPVILKDVGGGAVGAIQRTSPRLAISRVEVEGTTIVYYGQDTSRVTDSEGGTSSVEGSSNQVEQYYSNPATLTADAQANMLSQASDPESLYHSMVSLSDASAARGERRTCNMARTILIQEVTTSCDDPLPSNYLPPVIESENEAGCQKTYDVWQDAYNDGCSTYEQNSSCRLEKEVVDQVTTYEFFNPTGLSPLPSSREFLGSYYHLNTVLFESHSLSGNHFNHAVDVTLNDLLEGDTLVFSNVKLWHSTGSGCQHTHGHLGVMSLPDETVLHSKTEGGAVTVCWNIGTSWQIYDYTVPSDGTHSFRIFGGAYDPGSHSLSFQYAVRLIRDTRRGDVFVRPWWQKQATYFCEDVAPYNFDDIRRRTRSITESTERSGGTVSYTDERKSDGNWVTGAGSFTVSGWNDVGECENVCKTRKPRESTEVSVSGHEQEYRESITTWDFFYRPCDGAICPAEEGEEIIQSCQCINEFAEAATVMQVLRLAGEDTICSSGEAKIFP
ncbi:hypothetical protein [Geoalkalibacter halelectricus]|uniref:hypothetical protein n=1 Tax=Geoalkalibacter halelectricus TaxID=2847045 RepID=UPI00266F8A0C|nr:hypothetical protein [Geoalkalibacter halelectricus]MDO3380351.1 hypothetical protein [Geoalkalibacter halelectricus]